MSKYFVDFNTQYSFKLILLYWATNDFFSKIIISGLIKFILLVFLKRAVNLLISSLGTAICWVNNGDELLINFKTSLLKFWEFLYVVKELAWYLENDI